MVKKFIDVRRLYKSKYTCCICKDSTKQISVHKIEPWEISRTYKEENLIVLCLEHHSEAHTKHDLAINLTIIKLKVAKEMWVA